MIAPATSARPWVLGAGAVSLAHVGAVAGLVWIGVDERPMPVEEPVVLIELPPLGAEAAAPSAAPAAEPADAPTPPMPAVQPRFDAPVVSAPLPRQVVAAPPPAQVAAAPAPAQYASPAVVAAAAPSRPAPAPNTSPAAQQGSDTGGGDNPRAKQQEANYYAQLSAHLNKRKRYPTEAKKARQQGVVTVRFTVHRDGSVSGSSIRRSSGHTLLDQATLELLARVAPLPRFPKSMTKDSVTLSLPIDYSLQTT